MYTDVQKKKGKKCFENREGNTCLPDQSKHTGIGIVTANTTYSWCNHTQRSKAELSIYRNVVIDKIEL